MGERSGRRGGGRGGAVRMRRLGALALVLAFSCLGALAGAGTASALYRVVAVAPLPAVEVSAPADGWARCYEDGACYDASDGWGAYRVRYVGADASVDVAAALTADGKLCGTEVTSTYRMFADAPASLKEVRLPDIARFGGELDPTTFEGAASPSIDVLYREAGATADSGAAVASASVTPWLVATDGNVDANAGAYRGSAKNVLVSSDVSSLAGLFAGSGVERVRLDAGEANPAWDSAAYLFANCASLEDLEGFALPEGVADASYLFSGCGSLDGLPAGFSLPDGLENAAGMFSDCSNLAAGAIPAGFRLPSTTTDAHGLFNGCISLEAVPDGLLADAASLQDASGMFAGTGLAAVPDGLLDGAPDLTDASAMFQGCASLASVPEGLFGNDGGLLDASSLFAGCGLLSGALDLPSSVTGVENMVDGAGASAASHPYDDKGADVGGAGSYSVIVRYDGAAASAASKAYVERVNADASSRARFVAPVAWEKVGAADGPYTDTATGKRFYLRYKGSARSVDVAAELDANGEILGVVPTTTDRMFQGLDPNVEEVVLPDVSAYATRVDPDTFGGDLGHKVDLRYRDAAGADYSGAFDGTDDAARARAWLYLESGNLTNGTYKGPARNVYISDGITSFENLFEGSGTIEAIDTTGDYAEWTSTRYMFSGCVKLVELPAGFLASAPKLVDASRMLMDATRLSELPSGFLANAPVLANADYILGGTEALKSLPEGFLSNAPELQSARFAFVSCSRLEHVNQDFLRSSAKLKDITAVFQLCTALRGELTLDLPGIDACEAVLYNAGTSVSSNELAYDGEGSYVGPGKGSLAFVVRYPPESSAFAAEAAKGPAKGGRAKLVPIERTSVILTDEEASGGSSDELVPGDGEPDGAQADAPEGQGGEAGSPLDGPAAGDGPVEPLPDAEGPDPAPDAEPALPDAAPSEDAPEPDPEAPAEPDAPAADGEARVTVRPEREEGPLSVDPPGIVAVAAGGLGLGECFRRRETKETKGRG